MIKNTGKVLYWFFLMFLVLTAGIVAVSALNIPGNIKFLIVESGSMEPAIKTGSIVVVKPQAKYKIGDIVTAYDSANQKVSVTHRILDVQGGTFVTKGDANSSADTEIRHREDIVGKALFSVPLIGYLTGFAKTQEGLILLVIIPAVLIMYNEVLTIKNALPQLIHSRKKGLRSFRLTKILVMLPLIVVSLVTIEYSRAKYTTTITAGAVMTASTWAPSIHLSLYKEDATHVGFKITGTELKSYDSLEYLVIYDTDQTPQGISGNKTLNGATTVTESGLLLGYCTTGGTCTNFTGVANIKIEVRLKNSQETKIVTSGL